MTAQSPKYVETYVARRSSKLAERIHQTILAIDAELITAVDWQYRSRLVEVAYALRNLEESIQRGKKLARWLPNSRMSRRKGTSLRIN